MKGVAIVSCYLSTPHSTNGNPVAEFTKCNGALPEYLDHLAVNNQVECLIMRGHYLFLGVICITIKVTFCIFVRPQSLIQIAYICRMIWYHYLQIALQSLLELFKAAL